MHARGLRLRGVQRILAITHPPVLPSAMLNDVGTPVAIISQLNTLPACAPVNASMAALRLATHDSGSGWFASPFLYDSSIHYSTPAYPGALRSLLVYRFTKMYSH
jgi:cell division inhibitor SulA